MVCGCLGGIRSKKKQYTPDEKLPQQPPAAEKNETQKPEPIPLAAADFSKFANSGCPAFRWAPFRVVSSIGWPVRPSLREEHMPEPILQEITNYVKQRGNTIHLYTTLADVRAEVCSLE